MRRLLILVALMVGGCSATTISSPISLGIPTVDRGIVLEDTTEQNWILVLVMMNPARDIITIAVDTYTTLDQCLSMWSEYSAQVPTQDKSQQLLCLLDNSPNNTSHNEIPALLTPKETSSIPTGPLVEGGTLPDKVIDIEEVTDEII